MPITLGSNIASLTAQRRLSEGTSQLGKTYERLSSGLRINRASDDAAGLAIADSLRSDSRVFAQGVRNLNDGISLLNIADSAIENLSSIVIRLEELAEQSANGTYGAMQRKAIDAEAQALSKEFFRISKTTSFNGQQLLSGSLGRVNLQAGIGSNSVLSAGIGGAIGTGTFSGLTSYSAEALGTFAGMLGDINGDGMLDLMTAGNIGTPGNYEGYATIRLGSGNGSFGQAVSYVTETNASYSATLGDINGDGILDLVTAGDSEALNGYATVRLGIGNGTFGTAVSYATESRRSRGVKLGDLNGDGVLDLVTAGYSTALQGFATVRLGTGSGSFGSATSFLMEGSRSTSLVLGDVNGDSILDLVTAGFDASSGRATVRLGNGSGSFGTATSYVTEGTQSFAVTLGDLNGDGILDLLSAGQSATGGFTTVRLGSSNGTFGTSTSYATETLLSRSVEIKDLNGDGILDLITGGRNTGPVGGINIRMGQGDGTFGTATSYASDIWESRAVLFGDLDGNGVLDLATAGSGVAGSAGSATVRLAQVQDGVSPLLSFSLTTMADARQALPIFQQKRNQLAAQRGHIGAFQSRIHVAANVLQVASENFRAAESRIRDADIAQESAELARLNILQQASAAILAQANQQPALALRLLGGVG